MIYEVIAHSFHATDQAQTVTVTTHRSESTFESIVRDIAANNGIMYQFGGQLIWTPYHQIIRIKLLSELNEPPV